MSKKLEKSFRNYCNKDVFGNKQKVVYGYEKWWNKLTIDEQVFYRKDYEEKRIINAKRKIPFPMASTEGLRLSQLSMDKHIYRIYVFHDKDKSYFK